MARMLEGISNNAKLRPTAAGDLLQSCFFVSFVSIVAFCRISLLLFFVFFVNFCNSCLTAVEPHGKTDVQNSSPRNQST